MRPTIRVAENSDGKLIGELAWSCGFKLEGVTWDDIHPYWLVAELHGGLVGAVQVLIGKPIGRIENLSVMPSLRKIERAQVVASLLYQARAVLNDAGVQVATGFIPERFEEYGRVLSNRGCWSTGFGDLVMTRV